MNTPTQPRSPNRAIAAIAYTVLRAYRMAIGESGGPAWESAPDALKAKVLANVDFVRGQEEPPTAEFMHRRWVSAKMIDGWASGVKRSDALKLHDRMRPFETLQRDQQAKGEIFLALVRTLAPLVVALDQAEDRLQQFAQDSLTEQQGALLFITAMVKRFGGETGVVQLSDADMRAATHYELMRHDSEDGGLLLKVERMHLPGDDPTVLDTSLPAGG